MSVLKKKYLEEAIGIFSLLFFSSKVSHKCQPVLYETRPMTTSQYSPGSWMGFWMVMTTDCGLGWEVSVPPAEAWEDPGRQHPQP